MTTLTKFFMLYMIALASQSSNPVKLSVILVILSSMIFLNMNLLTGLSWFPMIYLLIFMGGILMMFMILSSILPNEKSSKIKFNLNTGMLLILATISISKEDSGSLSATYMKSWMETNSSFILMVTLMMAYFFFTISMVSSENMPMRTVLCR